MEELISVIVPVYNVENYLEACVQSIWNQTYKNLEIILVDDGSTDKSGLLCDELAKKDTRIRVIHKQNGGLSSARNAGINVARGGWIGFVDSDDLIHCDMYKELTNLIERGGKDVNVAQIGIERFEDGTEPVRNENILEEASGELCAEDYLKQLLLHIGDASLCTKLCHKKLFESVRFNEEVLNEDFEFWIRQIYNNNRIQIAFTSTTLYYYRERKGSTTRSGFSQAIIDCIYNADLAYQLVKEKYPEMEDIAIRFCLVQNEGLLRRIPIRMMQKNNKHYRKALSFLRCNLGTAIYSRYLTRHQKRNILAFCICPKLAKRIYSMIYGDNYNAC